MSTALVRACQVAKSRGADFPTVWSTVIQPHPLVSGSPVQTLRHDRPQLEIPLITGYVLVHDTGCNDYTLELADRTARGGADLIPITERRRPAR